MHHHGKECLRLRVDVVKHKASAKSQPEEAKTEETIKTERKVTFFAAGGVHNPSNRLPAGKKLFLCKRYRSHPAQSTSKQGSAGCVYHSWVLTWSADCPSPFRLSDDPAVMEPNVQRSIGSSAAQLASFSLFTIIPVLLATMLHWSPNRDISKPMLVIGTVFFLQDSLYIYIYEQRRFVLFSVCLMCWCECGVWIAPKKKEDLKNVFFF